MRNNQYKQHQMARTAHNTHLIRDEGNISEVEWVWVFPAWTEANVVVAIVSQ